MSCYPQRGACPHSGSHLFRLRRLWKLFRETNSLEFWNLQNVRLQSEETGHSTLLILQLFSHPKSAFCPPQKQWEILHGCIRGSQCQGLVWQDPAPRQGPGVWAVCSACARLLKLCSCSRATSCTVQQISQFSQHWAVPFLLTVVHSQIQPCATCVRVQRVVCRQTGSGLVPLP